MIWFTWRQFRTQTWITLGAVAIVAVVLAVIGLDVARQYAASGLAACPADCGSLVSDFLDRVGRGPGAPAYYLGIGAMYLLPALIGAFWGAPLIARELETGTYRLAWNQSVTRTRWLVTRLAGLGAVTIVATGLASLAVTWSASTIDQVYNGRIGPLLFGARGPVPVSYAVFAFTLGVTLGLLIRRTVPAMAATLAAYAAAVVAMPLWIRGHLAPIRHATPPLDVDAIEGLSRGSDDSPMRIVAQADLPGAWILANDTITPTGEVFDGPSNPAACGMGSSPTDCFAWVDSLGLRLRLDYHSADQFWSLQWTETGIFLALSLALTGFCIWWTRQRLG